MTEEKQQFSDNQAKQIGNVLGVDWNIYEVEQLRLGIEIELEHGVRDPHKNVTQEDLLYSGKIAWAHLNDNPDYYTRFERIG